MMNEKEKLQKEYEEKLRAIEQKENIENILPIPSKRIFIASKKEPWITYEVENLQSALEVISKFELIPMYIIKDSCTNIQPEEWINKEKFSNRSLEEKTENIIQLELDKMEKYQTKGKFIFYTKIQDQVMKIIVELKQIPFEWHIRSEVNYNKQGEITTNKHDLQYNSENYKIKWWSSPGNARFSLFWNNISNFESVMNKFVREK